MWTWVCPTPRPLSAGDAVSVSVPRPPNAGHSVPVVIDGIHYLCRERKSGGLGGTGCVYGCQRRWPRMGHFLERDLGKEKASVSGHPSPVGSELQMRTGG